MRSFIPRTGAPWPIGKCEQFNRADMQAQGNDHSARHCLPPKCRRKSISIRLRTAALGHARGTGRMQNGTRCAATGIRQARFIWWPLGATLTMATGVHAKRCFVRDALASSTDARHSFVYSTPFVNNAFVRACASLGQMKLSARNAKPTIFFPVHFWCLPLRGLFWLLSAFCLFVSPFLFSLSGHPIKNRSPSVNRT